MSVHMAWANRSALDEATTAPFTLTHTPTLKTVQVKAEHRKHIKHTQMGKPTALTDEETTTSVKEPFAKQSHSQYLAQVSASLLHMYMCMDGFWASAHFSQSLLCAQTIRVSVCVRVHVPSFIHTSV